MWFLLFFLLFSNPVLAQDSTDLYTQYRTDYFFQRDNYQKDYLDYLNKKDTYAQFGTVTAEKDKITATKNTFLSQNLMLKAYLMALRTTLGDSPENQQKLQQYENWLDTQNQLVSNLNSTPGLQTWAHTFRVQFVSIQKELFTGLVQGQINRRQRTLENIKKLAEKAKIEWSSNYLNKESMVSENFRLALKETQRNQREDRFSEFYPEAKNYLNQADTQIKSMISDLKSTIIKNHL